MAGRKEGGNGHRTGGALWATVTRVLFTIFPYLQCLRPKRDGACLLDSLWHPQLLEQCQTHERCPGKYLLKSFHLHFWEERAHRQGA